ncbi:IclR family transcriptional regulator [Aureimonas jatrophae]|uniref:DNA-binding transcriptional regulator, IclR family n=1 Tax=Aureimonas jatrophae TaxID=1166073 RepID=A0A1H0KMK5_9HYPH|nr:IclR family transcriptional regulator [Aureimonas jatrophae]MBB3948778.1 DNA-binding IclR family transcriptional regulator [Aureimonas jatrophae]SDO56980.1 DNA-binding transcriptional regulator, IclR family [Aureimonas jatrophae]
MSEQDVSMTDDADPGPRYHAPALEKGLDILEHLGSVTDAPTLGDLGEALGRTRGEIFRMVAVLERRGYIERVAPDRFALSDRLFSLAMQQPRQRALAEAALPEMRRFAEETGHSCHLAVASGSQMVVVAHVPSPAHVGFAVRIGHRQPIALTGSGLCLLAFMSPARRERTLQDSPERDGQRAWLAETLGSIRAAGHVLRPSRLAEGITDISAPVIDPATGEVLAALSCPFIRLLDAAEQPADLADRLRDAAGRIANCVENG